MKTVIIAHQHVRNVYVIYRYSLWVFCSNFRGFRFSLFWNRSSIKHHWISQVEVIKIKCDIISLLLDQPYVFKRMQVGVPNMILYSLWNYGRHIYIIISPLKSSSLDFFSPVRLFSLFGHKTLKIGWIVTTYGLIDTLIPSPNKWPVKYS